MKTPVIISLLATLALPVNAGNLVPPPGEPGSTMKTLDEVEARTPVHASDIPLVISSPGSYYFVEDIQVSAGAGLTTAAILIESSHVKIDLNGYALRGANVSTISGIYANGPFQSIVITNGQVAQWEEYGIFLAADAVDISHMHVIDNTGTGICLDSGRISHSLVRDNGISGIVFRPDPPLTFGTGSCVIEHCEVYGHGETGISAKRPISIRKTVSSLNVNGILLYAPGSTIEYCVCNKNDHSGILVSQTATDCVISANQCSENQESGIVISSRGCRVEGNHAARNSLNGIVVNQRSMFFKNTAYDNADGNYSKVNEAIFGPIVTTTNIDGSLASTHPWANFSFHTTTIGN